MQFNCVPHVCKVTSSFQELFLWLLLFFSLFQQDTTYSLFAKYMIHMCNDGELFVIVYSTKKVCVEQTTHSMVMAPLRYTCLIYSHFQRPKCGRVGFDKNVVRQYFFPLRDMNTIDGHLTCFHNRYFLSKIGRKFKVR